ncbi:hypothetical protein D9M73_261630 [compost metagenome]
MAGQLLASDPAFARQRVADRAHRDHLHAAQGTAFQGSRDAFVEEEQAQIGAPLHQLARHVALGTAGQLDFH